MLVLQTYNTIELFHGLLIKKPARSRLERINKFSKVFCMKTTFNIIISWYQAITARQ